jgi:hypothetical protein
MIAAAPSTAQCQKTAVTKTSINSLRNINTTLVTVSVLAGEDNIEYTDMLSQPAAQRKHIRYNGGFK